MKIFSSSIAIAMFVAASSLGVAYAADTPAEGYVTGDAPVQVTINADQRSLSKLGGKITAGSECFLQPSEHVVFVSATADGKVVAKKLVRMPKISVSALAAEAKALLNKARCPLHSIVTVDKVVFDAWAAQFKAENVKK